MSAKPLTGDPSEAPLVVILDDDEAVGSALSSLLRSVGYRVEVFLAPKELLQKGMPEAASCLVLDVRLPMISGLEFQRQLAAANNRTPIVFMTGHGDIPMSVKAMKAGAVDFLAKPFRDQDMLDAVAAAIERDRARRISEAGLDGLRRRLETLSKREQEVMALATAGLMNKQIAGELGLSEVTVKIHRGHVMQKMGARSFADLVRIAETLGIRRS
ncbi:DNA-binding response regulator [Hypericibacter adhaerens]|uniref:DNA-binding response regulator n=1 Tax=Hypericibacter adhaerens TaxID=2602016 RepID=A0A5J6MRZ2_9PROT|nr:response regulator [Hypericibacter adhaerens]QEX20372.1 DNA-binding response regulator [Hypericibacter adhaerens]